MSRQENLQTAETFASTWLSSPEWVMTEGVRSVYFETHRLDHSYPFYIDDEGIFVCNPKNPSEKFYVRNIVDKSSHLGRIELKIFDELENLAHEKAYPGECKMAVWFSPPFPGRYPCSKVIIHQIVNEPGTNIKKILNLVKVFDLSANSCVQIAQRIFPELTDIKNSEQLRSCLIIPTSGYQIDQLISEIDEINEEAKKSATLLGENELTERSEKIVYMVQRQIDPSIIAAEMDRQNLLGEHSISCPTISEFLAGGVNSDILQPYFNCPRCGGKIESGKGITTCPHCGLTKEAAGSTCV